GGVVGQLDLDSEVGVAVAVGGDVGDAQLGRPGPGRDRAGQEATGRAAGDVAARRGQVVGLAREALHGDGDVGMARAAPAAELGLGPGLVALARLPDAEVDGVAALPAVLDPDLCRAGRHL